MKPKNILRWGVYYFLTLMLMLILDRYVLQSFNDKWPDFVTFVDGIFGLFALVGGVLFFLIGCGEDIKGPVNTQTNTQTQPQQQKGSLMVLFGQRKCNYDGEFAVEALECMDGFGYSENPDYLAGKLTEYEESGDFERLAILPLSLDYDEITKRLYPESGNAILVAGIAC